MEIINKYFKAFEQKDIETLQSLFADNIQLKDWVIDVVGKKNVILAMTSIFNTFQKIKVEVLNTIIENTSTSNEIVITLDDTIIRVVDIIETQDNQIIKISAYKQH